MSEVDSIFLKLKKIITELADGKTSKSLAISELCFILMNVNTDAKPSGLINSFKNNIYLSVLNQIMKVQDSIIDPSSMGSISKRIFKVLNKSDSSYLISNINFSNMCLPNVRFQDMQIIGCNFDNSDLRNSSFNKCELQGCSFKGADISHSKILKTRFIGCSMDGANVTDVKGL